MNIKSKKVLVTGADGFIGSHLAEKLISEGAFVTAFCYYNSFNSWGWLDTFSKDTLKKIHVVTGDVRDPHGMQKAMKGHHVVFHLAALIGIPYSYHSPDNYVDTNIKGTLNVLQAAKDHKVQRVLAISTSEVYGTAKYIPIDEKHPLQGQSPYSASKIASDKMAESFYRSFETPVVIARPFNTYGPRQSARAVIPTIISQLLNGEEKIHLGSLSPVRDFNFVSDICAGLISLSQCDKAVGMEVNVGSGKAVSIKELAETLISLINQKAKITSEESRKRPKKSEVEHLLCDNRLIKKLTNWKPEVSLKEGLEITIDWFKDNLNRYKSDIYNV